MSDEELLLPIERGSMRGEYRKYFLAKRNNYYATIQNFADLWDCFLRLDEIWKSEFDDLQGVVRPGQVLPIHLFMNSHAQYRVAFELAFSTCMGEAWNILRSSIESAVQGHKIHREPQLARVWLQKDDGPEQAKLYKKAFEARKKDSLFPVEHGLRELYDYYSDYSELGTHSTMAAIALRHNMETDSKDVHFRHEYLEANPQRIATFLFRMFLACVLIERACFDAFKERLSLDYKLSDMRSQLADRQRQTANALIHEFNIQPGI